MENPLGQETTEIRPATAEDLDGLVALFAEFLDNQFSLDPFARRNPEFNAELYWKFKLSHPDTRVFVAIRTSEYIGFSVCSLQRQGGAVSRGIKSRIKRYLKWLLGGQKGGSSGQTQYVFPTTSGYLNNVYVKPGFRRQGIGEELVKLRISALEEMGVNEIYTHVLSANVPSQELLSRAGFRALSITMKRSSPEAEGAGKDNSSS